MSYKHEVWTFVTDTKNLDFNTFLQTKANGDLDYLCNT